MAMRPLHDVIRAEAALAGLLDRRKRELAVLTRLQELLPPALAPQIRVADASRPELLLFTGTGAAAALIRHRVPEMLEKLTREGWKFTGIRVRVQPRESARERSKLYAKQMDTAAAAALRAGAAAVGDARLAAALRRLAGCATSEDEQQALQRVEGEDAQQKK